MKDRKGIALIMAVGILAVLAAIATSFALNMRLEYKAAMNYSNGVKARYAAEAGVQAAILLLRDEAKSSAFDDLSEPWSSHPAATIKWDIVSESGVSIGSDGTAYATIEDEQRKININTANQTLLQNLFTELGENAYAAYALYNKINKTGYLSPNRGYNNLQELKSIAGLTEGEFDTIRGYVTTTSYVDDNPNTGANTGRSPININTADPIVLQAVFDGIASGAGDEVPVDTNITEDMASSLVEAVTRPRYYSEPHYTSWKQFNDCIDSGVGYFGFGSFGSDEATLVKYNCNPNRPKPSTYTTEFCFNSGGVYEITGTGEVTDASGATIATRTVTAIVKIYGIYNETTKGDFENGTSVRTTWLDSCPVNSDALFDCYEVGDNATPQLIRGSIKLGYWDDFEDAPYSEANWVNDVSPGVRAEYEISEQYSPGDPHIQSKYSPNLPDREDGKFKLSKLLDLDNDGSTDDEVWAFGDFSMRFREKDEEGDLSLLRHAGQVIFNKIGGAPEDEVAILEGGRNPLAWGNPQSFAWDIPKVDDECDVTGWNPTNPYPGYSVYFEWMPVSEARNYETGYGETGNGTCRINLTETAGYSRLNDCKHTFDSQIRIWPNAHPTGKPHTWNPGDDVTEYFEVCTNDYVEEKTFNITRTGSSVTVTRIAGSDVVGPVLKDDCFTGDTTIVFDCGEAVPYWDDVRIISPDGNYTSETITPDGGNDVVWGTVTGTIYHPTSATGDEDIVIQTSANGLSDDDPTAFVHFSLNAEEPFMALLNPSQAQFRSPSIQYKAFLSQNVADTEMQETPVLEDVTITYLPKVQILSWKIK